MTCYFRHLKKVFERAGIVVTRENRNKIDRVVHSIVGVKYANCPAAWKEIKKRLEDNEEAFVAKLREEWSKRI